jgi:hypothetical protein
MNDTPAGRINREQQPLASFDESKRCIASASRFLPGGVSSNFRLGMIPTPLVIGGPTDRSCLMSMATG